MYHDIIFKIKWDFEKNKMESISYQTILESIKQLNNWVASLWWRLVYWFGALDELKIVEKNYRQNINSDYYDIDDNWHEFCLSDLPDEAWWRPEEIDITNKVFLELWIKWETKYSQLVFFQKWILNIFGKEFIFEKGSKIYETLDLYFKARNYFWNEKITFEQLEEVFKNQQYQLLKVKDLKYEALRSLLKNRMKQIAEEIWVESVLDIKTGYLKIGE